MRTPKTKRTALTQAVISSFTGETLSIKKKRKAFGHLLTQVLPTLVVVGLFSPNASLAVNFDSNDGKGYVLENGMYTADPNTGGKYIGSVSENSSIYGLQYTEKSSGANITVDNTKNVYDVFGAHTDDTGVSANSNTVAVINGSEILNRVFGGYVTGGDGTADGNVVEITSSTVASHVYGGYSVNGKGTTSSNKVTINNSSSGGNVYGGHSYTGAAENNTVTITGGSKVDNFVRDETGYIYGGYASGTGSASNNTVTIEKSSVGSVYGGHSEGGPANENTVKITGSTIVSDIYGGHAAENGESSDETAYKNTVYISESTDSGNVFGGRVSGIKGDATCNEVTITASSKIKISSDSSVTSSGNVFGGYISNSESEGNVSENIVTIEEGSTVEADAYGGYVAGSGNAYSNKISVDSSAVGRLFGAHANAGDAYSNTVTITGKNSQSTISEVYGGYATSGSGSVYKNEVSIDNSLVEYVYGGHTSSATGSAYSNKVTITGSTINKNVSGGHVASGTADDDDETTETTKGAAYSNKITITGSAITGDVNGGYVADSGPAYENEVSLDNSSAANVSGGYADDKNADGYANSNKVTVTNNSEITTNVYGGYAAGSGTASSNEVTVDGSKVNNVTGGRSNNASGSGQANSNKVTIQNGSNLTGTAYGGYAAGSGSASSNEVTVDGSEVNNVTGGRSNYASGSGKADSNIVTIQNGSNLTSTAYGGYAAGSGSASSNNVSVDGSSAGSVYGARSNDGNAESNTVKITSSKITSDVYGALAQNGSASSNKVTVGDSSADYVIGGRVRGDGNTGNADGNIVTITNSTINSNVIGGNTAGSGSASSNKVSVKETTVTGAVYGGVSLEGGKASSNIVELNNATVTAGETTIRPAAGDPELSAIYGGRSIGGGEVSGNEVTITGGTISSDIYGGHSGTGAISSNTVTLNDGKITGDTFAAGYSTGSGEVSDNVFNINGGTLSGGFTYGGYSKGGGSVSGNTINLNGGTVSGTLYAGYGSDTSKVKNNTINLDGNVESRLSDINVENAILYGSNLAQATGSNGNTLNIQNFSGKIGNIGVFDNVNLDLSGIDLANAVYGSGSVIILTDSAGEGTNFTNSTVNIYNSSSSYSLAVGFTSESELSDEYTIFANANGDMTKTNATINEKIMVVQDPDKYPNLIAYSEYDLSSDDDGTISYILNPETAGTYVPNEGRTVTALAGAGAKLSMYYAQLDDLRKRLGEVRYGAQDGIWARFIYQQDSFAGTSSYDAKQRWYGLNVGFDRIASQDEDRMWLLGANFKYGHAKQKVTQSLGGKGNLNSYGVNLYATYANQYGCYADFVVTFDDYHQKLGVKTGDTSSSSGDYSSWGWGASIELGKMFSTKQNDENWGPWHNHWWVEPQAQLSYYWLKGKDFVMSSGKDVSQNNGQSLVGRLGLVVGKHWSYGGADKVDKRYVQVYLKGGVKHEFLGKQDLRYAGKLYNDRLRGTTGYYGAGVDWNLTKQVRAYAQVERESGGKYKKDIEASIGLKWQF